MLRLGSGRILQHQLLHWHAEAILLRKRMRTLLLNMMNWQNCLPETQSLSHSHHNSYISILSIKCTPSSVFCSINRHLNKLVDRNVALCFPHEPLHSCHSNTATAGCMSSLLYFSLFSQGQSNLNAPAWIILRERYWRLYNLSTMPSSYLSSRSDVPVGFHSLDSAPTQAILLRDESNFAECVVGCAICECE